MSVRRAGVLIGHGVEELEAVAPVDLLRRAGVSCTVVSCESTRLITGRNDLRIEADALLDGLDGDLWDALVLPGGPMTARLRIDARVLERVRAHWSGQRIVAAICAAPLILLNAGVLPGPRYTGHASIRPELPNLLDQDVVQDDRLITSRGAGTAVAFGLALVTALAGGEMATDVARSIHSP